MTEPGGEIIMSETDRKFQAPKQSESTEETPEPRRWVRGQTATELTATEVESSLPRRRFQRGPMLETPQIPPVQGPPMVSRVIKRDELPK